MLAISEWFVFTIQKKIMDVESWSLIQKPRQAKADLLVSIINITRKKGKLINYNRVKANTIKAKIIKAA